MILTVTSNWLMFSLEAMALFCVRYAPNLRVCSFPHGCFSASNVEGGATLPASCPSCAKVSHVG